MKIRIMALVLFTMIACLYSQVVSPVLEGALKVDGKLDDADWLKAPVFGNFTHPRLSGGAPAQVPTEFRVMANQDAVYIGIKSTEPNPVGLNKQAKGALWTGNSDNVEIFLAPSGDPEGYYQFVVSAGNNRFAMYYGESGKIKPDPYAPEWSSAVAYGPDSWTAEIRIPLGAFYMTRNNQWRDQWLVNVGRIRKREVSSWSPLESGFQESSSFNKLAGFPIRRTAEDVFLRSIEFDAAGVDGERYHGTLAVAAEVAKEATGKRILSVKTPDGREFKQEFKLVPGVNMLVFNDVELHRKPGDGIIQQLEAVLDIPGAATLRRFYPCTVEYMPIGIVLTTPAYRNNFYPGQEASRIAGTVRANAPGAKTVQISAVGSQTPERSIAVKLADLQAGFELDKIELPSGAELTVKATALDAEGRVLASTELKVCRPVVPAGTCNPGWIANGCYVLDGKPTLPCDIFSIYYRGGRKFNKRFDDEGMGDMAPFKISGVQEWRIASNAEAITDAPPSASVLEKARELSKLLPERKAHAYYISDEPECRQISPVFLRGVYLFLRELDPFHPVVITARSPNRYRECADIILTHPYLCPVCTNDGRRGYLRPVVATRDYVRQIIQGNLVAGFCGQWFCSTPANNDFSYPTFEELEVSTWSALANGARILYPYAFHDLGDRPRLYEGFRYLNTSARALSPWLLSNQRHSAKSTLDPVTSDVMLVEADGALLLAIVNLVSEPASGRVEADVLKSFGELHEFRSDDKFTLEQGVLEFKLKPYECLILATRPLGVELPKRAEVLAKISEAETLRKSRGNLLFEKGFSATGVSSSNPRSANSVAQQKLFDGVLDVQAWESAGRSADNFLEIEFPDRSPEFSRLGLYGDNLAGLEVRIWKRGEWQTPTPVKVDKDLDHAVYDFGKPLTTVKLRLDFAATPANGKTIELYEVEFLK